MGRAKSTAQVLGGNAHKGDAASECQGRYPDAAMQNMMLRLRKVKIQSHPFMKRFSVCIPKRYSSRNRDVLVFAVHSGDHATTDRSGSVNQISTNIDQNLPPICARSKAGGVASMVPQPMIGRRRQLVCQ
jgi:hypothetical protein